MSKTLLVMGPTGSTGSKTVKFLLDAGTRVRAFVHSEDERSAALAAHSSLRHLPDGRADVRLIYGSSHVQCHFGWEALEIAATKH
jgi:nucleoside-diphosphate-sugar epimerase